MHFDLQPNLTQFVQRFLLSCLTCLFPTKKGRLSASLWVLPNIYFFHLCPQFKFKHFAYHIEM
uniref:Uncharacterized protein n=1 Tax=Siphoviridae sp. ctLAw30 TaxID=2826249 RepID=A0A8S5M1E9_9CAUD|nr:MAG TPA: hypothetical protein [Siphoviridae sp. ctLAw30]